MDIAKKIKLMVSGNYHSRYTANGPVALICFSCRRTFMAKDSHGIFHFCHPCYKRYFLRSSGTEISGLDRTREIVRIRDQHTCQSCGKIWEQGQRRFDIHHLNGVCGKKSRSYDKVEYIDGLVTLCHKCHLNLPEVNYKMRMRSSPRPDKYGAWD